MIELHTLTIEKVHHSLKTGEYTVRELVQTYLDTIGEKNKDINAYLETYTDLFEQADRAQERFANGTATLLTGIPFALKDNLLVKGELVTAGSKILDGYRAIYDGTVISLLKKENAILIGRTNMDEFAMGSSTETSAYGVTRNPLDVMRVPGGSSGGSSAAVAMDGALVALGSDTGGSIRQPAAFCGLVGLKPTYGSVSRYGVIAMGSSLDQIGPITKTVRDAEIIHDCIAQYDAHDSTSLPVSVRTSEKAPIKKRIGVPRAFVEMEGIDPAVAATFARTIEQFRGLGYEIVDVSLPLMPYSLAVYYILMPAESSSNLARFDGIRYGKQILGDSLLDVYMQSRGQGFGREVRRRILLGTYVLSHGYYDAYYNKAVKMKNAITRELTDIFADVDVIMTPTTPTEAFTFGEKSSDPVAMYLSDIFTVPANIAGNPSLSVPSGTGTLGMPLGVQFTALHNREDTLFAYGKIAETFVY